MDRINSSRRRTSAFLLGLCVASVTLFTTAQGAWDEPRELAWQTGNEITLMAGYRISDDLQITSNLEETDPDQAEQNALSVEETFGYTLIYNRTYRRRPNTQLEIYLSRQRTSLDTSEDLVGGDGFDLDVYYAHAGGLYLFPEQGAVPFLAGTIGITHMRPTDNDYSAETRFSLRIGGGLKLPLSKNIALRLEATGLFTFFNTNTAIFCSGGCVARVEGNAFTQVDLGAGLVFAF